MRFLLSIFLGVLASLGFAPYSIWLAPIIALSLFFNILKKQCLTDRLLLSFLFGLGLLLPNQFWTGIYVGDLPWITLALLQSFLFLPMAVVTPRGGKYNPLLFAFGLIVSELLLRTIPFTGFGWSRLSFTQVDGFLSSFYPLFGGVGVAFLLAFIAANRDVQAFLLIFLMIIGLNFWPNKPIVENQLKIALVQGGVKNLGLDFNSTPKEVFQRHLQTTLTNLKGKQVDLVIWPENSVDIDLFKNQDVQLLIRNASADLQTPILVGGITRSNGKLENVSVLFDPTITSTYVKRYLTPFGEYIPLRSLLEKITPLTDDVVDFSAGTNSNQMKIGKFTSDLFICYEILNDQFKNQINSDFIIVQTNNATFGDTNQLDQELQIARVRALESGREVAYVSTTGVTSFIDRKGKINSEIPKFQSNVLIDKVNTYSDIQINQRVGFYPEIFACFMIFFIHMRIRRSK
jgi:apolipoprotein N-acyltransferase